MSFNRGPLWHRDFHLSSGSLASGNAILIGVDDDLAAAASNFKRRILIGAIRPALFQTANGLAACHLYRIRVDAGDAGVAAELSMITRGALVDAFSPAIGNSKLSPNMSMPPMVMPLCGNQLSTPRTVWTETPIRQTNTIRIHSPAGHTARREFLFSCCPE